MERGEGTAVLYLPSSCVRAGMWARQENLNAPPNFAEPGEVIAEVPKPDGPLSHISSDLAGHPCPSLFILCVSLANGEPGDSSVTLLILVPSSLKIHSRETEPTTPTMEMIGGWSFPAFLHVQFGSEHKIGDGWGGVLHQLKELAALTLSLVQTEFAHSLSKFATV